MPTLGTAYVQIAPSAQGISGSISSLLDPEAASAGTSAGVKIGSFAKKALVAAGIGAAFVKVVKDSMAEGGKLQQSYIGGLDTLYGTAAESAREYAKEAAKAGISMNTYSEQAVSFGAALKQAYGGDAKKAVEAANTAILDMADNSAKMGTDIGMVQNAYQGFAKQNYTMLDNLKLGYGGTKTEMQRLLADAEALTGKKYDLSNLGDVYDAIHVIQDQLHIAGTAAAEAGGTFTGSFGSMKAAAQNFLGELALGMDVSDSLNVLITSANSFFFGNFIPMLGNIVKALPGAIGAFITQGAPMLMSSVSNLVSSFATWIGNFAKGLTGEKVSAWVSDTLPKILNAADGVMGKFLEGILKSIGKVAVAVGKIGITIVTGLGSAIWGKVSAAAAGIRDRFMAHITNLITRVTTAASNIRTGFITHINNLVNSVATAASNLKSRFMEKVDSLKTSIATAAASIRDKFMSPINELIGKVQGVINKIKGKFPIKLGKALNIQLPKISIGSTEKEVAGKKFKVPTFDISWHAKGGIFDQPTLLQGLDGSLHGVGDAGPEAIIPLNTLWDKLDKMQGGDNITINVYASEGMNVRELAEEVAKRITDTEKQRRLAWQ